MDSAADGRDDHDDEPERENSAESAAIGNDLQVVVVSVIEPVETYSIAIRRIDRVERAEAGAQYRVVANHLQRVVPDRCAAQIGSTRADQRINGVAETVHDPRGADPTHSGDDRQGNNGDRPDSGQAESSGLQRVIPSIGPARTPAQKRHQRHRCRQADDATTRAGDDPRRSHQRRGKSVQQPRRAADDRQDESERDGHDHGHIARKVIVVDERPEHRVVRGSQPVKPPVPGEVLDQRKGRHHCSKYGEDIGQQEEPVADGPKIGRKHERHR